MTKVQLEYDLLRPLDEVLMQRIADAHGIYGFQRIRLTPSLDGIVVEYDASRLTAAQVEAALRRAGIAVKRKQTTAPSPSPVAAASPIRA